MQSRSQGNGVRDGSRCGARTRGAAASATAPSSEARAPQLLALRFLLALGLALAIGAGPGSATARAAPPPPPDEQLDELLTFGRSAYHKGDLEDALDAAEAVLEDEPTHPGAIDLLAKAHLARGDDERVAKRLVAMLEAHPQSAAARATLAGIVRAREPDRARKLYEEALAIEPEHVASLVGLGELLVEQGARDEAEKILAQAFATYRRAPTLDAELVILAARAAEASAEVPALAAQHVRPFAEEARGLYQRAFRMDGANPDLLVRWAALYLRKWDLPEGRKLLRRALEIAPRHAQAHALLAQSYLDDLYGGTANYDRAREAIERALGQNPRLALAHILRAELSVTDALYTEAVASLDAALAASPRDPRALGDKAGVLRLGDRLDEASAVEALVARLAPRQASEAWRHLARVLDQKFRYREAYEAAKRAVELDPLHIPAQTQLGLQAMRVGQEEEAKEALTRAHAEDPFDLYAFNLLTLLDYLDKSFVTYETAHFVVRLERTEEPWLRPFLDELAERSWTELAERYGVTLAAADQGDRPLERSQKILLEVFPNLQDFSVRAVAHRFIPASGVTFERVVALASPRALPPGSHGWGRVLWHELAHVATLERTRQRVPRWLTEGIAVYEESKGHPGWVREWDVMVVDALRRERLLPILELDQGFSKPRFPNQVILSYYQGGLVCRFLEAHHGFAAILALLDGYRDGVPLATSLERTTGLAPEAFDRAFLAWVASQFSDVRYRPQADAPHLLAELKRRAQARASDLDAQVAFAFACADLGRWADAEVAVGRILKLDDGSGDARLIDARVALYRGREERAMELLADALALGTRDPLAARLLRAQYYASPRQRGERAPRDARQAVRELEAARELFPRRPETLAALEQLYTQLEEAEKLTALEDANVELRPQDAQLRLKVAERARNEGDLARAKRLLEECIWIAPQVPAVHAGRALVAARMGDEAEVERALEILDRTLPAGPEGQAFRAQIDKEIAAARAARAAPPAPAPAPEDAPPAAPAPPDGAF